MATEQDLGAFYAERTQQHRAYVGECIQLAGKVSAALAAHLGAAAKLEPQPLKPTAGQVQISPNGVFQTNGVAIFAFALLVQGPLGDPYAATFFLSAGKLAGKEGKEKEGAQWFVGHEGESFAVPNGGDEKELAPLFAHVIGDVENAMKAAYPIDAQPPDRDAGAARDKRADAGDSRDEHGDKGDKGDKAGDGAKEKDAAVRKSEEKARARATA